MSSLKFLSTLSWMDIDNGFLPRLFYPKIQRLCQEFLAKNQCSTETTTENKPKFQCSNARNELKASELYEIHVVTLAFPRERGLKDLAPLSLGINQRKQTIS